MVQYFNALEGYSVIAIILIVFAVFFIIKEVRELIIYFKKIAQKQTEKELSQKEINEIVIKHDDDLPQLKESIKTACEGIEELKTDLSSLKQELSNDKQAELKERIGNRYRRIIDRSFRQNEPPFITEIEKEGIYALIKAYEDNGGKNSYVHEKVIPEMETWTVIEDK